MPEKNRSSTDSSSELKDGLLAEYRNISINDEKKLTCYCRSQARPTWLITLPWLVTLMSLAVAAALGFRPQPVCTAMPSWSDSDFSKLSQTPVAVLKNQSLIDE